MGAGLDHEIEAERGAPPGAIAARLFAALVVVAVTAAFMLFANLTLTFFFWKAAIGLNILLIAFGVLLWTSRGFTPFTPFWRHVLIVAVVASVVVSVWSFRPTWATQARHDARLSDMVAELCAIEVGAGHIEECRGSISNTGNGNSCRYLATAVVRSDGDIATVTEELESQGFEPTELDQFGEPMDDGRAYTFVGSDELHLSLQASWQPQEDDLRCT